MSLRALCLVALLSTSARATNRVPTTTLTLKNGLTVVLAEDHAVPRVLVSVRYQVGSSSESPGRTGFAHLFEHLMFEGSEHVPEGKFDEWLEAAGGDNNAFTSEDVTFYYEEVPNNAVELPLFLESDRMGFFIDTIAADLVEGQRDVVKNERRQSVENQPWGKAELVLPALLWGKDHPYSWPVIGSMDDLSAASLDDVKAFYQRFYTPKNAILVMVGDFKTDAVRALIEKQFADVPARGDRAVFAQAHRRLPHEQVVVVEDALAPLPKLIVAWPTVDSFHADDAPLDVAADVLGHDNASRLVRRLVHELHLAQHVAVYNDSRRRAGEFHIEVIAQPGVKLSRVLDVIDEEVDALATAGPTAPELARARAHVELDLSDDLDSLKGKAMRLSHYQQDLGVADGFAQDWARYERLAPSDVQQSTARWLTDGRVVISIVPPTQKDAAIAPAATAPPPAAPPATKAKQPVPASPKPAAGTR